MGNVVLILEHEHDVLPGDEREAGVFDISPQPFSLEDPKRLILHHKNHVGVILRFRFGSIGHGRIFPGKDPTHHGED